MKRCIRSTGLVLAFLLLTAPIAEASEALIPGGQIIGLSLQDGGVTVARLDETLQSGKNAGILPGDRITHLNGMEITNANALKDGLCRSHGSVTVRLIRGNQTLELTAKPDITAAGPRLGLYLREGITGVGTVTWYDPDSGRFGALGHSVNTSGQMLGGDVYRAKILSVKKGKTGAPGQLMGQLDPDGKIGALEKNSAQGVFGTLTEPVMGQPIQTAEPEQIKTGKATIRSTVSGNEVQEYSVKILKIYPEHRSDGRNMLIRITDPRLLDTTGGIVQGMSGSPIIQDGKLVGAVTHVLVNDPTTGYGIFIENMLDAAA